MGKSKRKVDLIVISDAHLGTYGCHAQELLRYLKSVNPKRVVLNGDIIDIWQFRKNYWPKAHMQVIRHIMNWIGKGVPVHYITGNHDEMLRKFEGFKLGSFQIQNKLVLKLNGECVWFFHGDVFDITMEHSKWLAKLGGFGYDLLILLNRFINWCSERMGRGRISLSKNVKDGVKKAVQFINRFETTVSEIAMEHGYDRVVCGHIHQPTIKKVVSEEGRIMYMNSGDWIENLSALEYNNGQWSIYEYWKDKSARTLVLKRNNKAYMSTEELYSRLAEQMTKQA